MYFGVQYRRWLFCIQLCGKDAFRRLESGDAGADGCGNSWIHGRYRRKRRGLHDAGRREKELANEYFSLIVYVTLVVSIVVGFICFALAPQIALALGADGELEADCVRYSRILFLSSPAFVMQYLFQSFFIAAEKPALSLKVNVIAGLTNAVLDYVLIVVFPLELVGAALATAAGQLVGGIIPVIYFSERTAAYCS